MICEYISINPLKINLKGGKKEIISSEKGKKPKNKPINNLGLTISGENKIQTCF